MGPGSTSWRALGTNVDVLTTEPSRLDHATAAVEHALAAADLAYSRFRFDSELTRLHDHPDRPIPVSALLFEALDAALRAARLSGGAVDPTVGGAIRRLGYDRDFAEVVASSSAATSASTTSAATASSALRLVSVPVPGWRTIQLDRVARTVRVPRGVEIDLGSIGKALAADLAALAAHRAAGCGVLVSLGGDLATAGQPPEGGWRVLAGEASHVRPEEDPDGEVVAIGRDAVATSSTTVRRWTSEGIVRHHLIDPATGLPTDGPWRTATVVAGTCVDANTASTAAIVRGADAPAWLASLGLPARLVAVDGDVVRVGGWPQPLARAS